MFNSVKKSELKKRSVKELNSYSESLKLQLEESKIQEAKSTDSAVIRHLIAQNPNFAKRVMNQFTNEQKMIDSEMGKIQDVLIEKSELSRIGIPLEMILKGQVKPEAYQSTLNSVAAPFLFASQARYLIVEISDSNEIVKISTSKKRVKQESVTDLASKMVAEQLKKN